MMGTGETWTNTGTGGLKNIFNGQNFITGDKSGHCGVGTRLRSRACGRWEMGVSGGRAWGRPDDRCVRRHGGRDRLGHRGVECNGKRGVPFRRSYTGE